MLDEDHHSSTSHLDALAATNDHDLAVEATKLSTLQESLQKTNQLCQDMIKQLDRFITNVDDLEPTMMPLHRNVSQGTRVYTNVNDTLRVLKLLSDTNDLVQRQDSILSSGLRLDELEVYLGAISRVSTALKELHDSKLGFCALTIEKLDRLHQVGIEGLIKKFRECMEQYSMPMLPTMALSVATEEEIPQGSAESLHQIVSFAIMNEMNQSIIDAYGDVRGKYQLKSLQGLFRNMDAPLKGAYHRGTHPFIAAIREFIRLGEKEIIFANKLFYSTEDSEDGMEALCHEAISKAIKHPGDLVLMSVEALRLKVTKGVSSGRKEYLEHIWIFDLIEVFNDIYYGCSQEIILGLLLKSLKLITATGIDFLRELAEHVQSAAAIGATGPVQVPSNATVLEQTSLLLNCLKKMLEFERVIESLLTRWSQEGSWDGLLGAISGGDGEVPSLSMALYYQDMLKALEVSIARHSHAYKRPITAALFQLNNYNYIVKTFRTATTLSSLVTMEAEQKYEKIVTSLTTDYLKQWSHLAELLDDASPRSQQPGFSPRDRLKAFATEWEDLIRSQQACAIPDAELKSLLIEQVHSLIHVPFITFYNMNQPVFVSLQGRIDLDPSTIEHQIKSLYQG